MFGLLNLDKPAGVTSRDIVNRVQRLVKPHKVGHCGTLDPLATGVLVIALGPATRLVEFVQRMSKTYRGTFLLGRSSDTEDTEGRVVELSSAPIPTVQHLQAALPLFVGAIQQVPPAFSALKVAGQRSYDLARSGKATALQPRPVEIHSLDIVRFAYPELELLIRCGSGTYVRSLGRDLARAVGTEAILSSLRREAIGPFTLAESTTCENLTLEFVGQHLLSPRMALGTLPHATVSAVEQQRLARGQSIACDECLAASEVAAINAAGDLVAILGPDGRGTWKPNKNFAAIASPRPG